MRFSIVAAAMLAVAGATAAAAQAVGSNPPPAPQPPTTLDRARANYEAILRGEKGLFTLSPTEQDEVRELDRRIRAQQPPDERDAFERCVDAEYGKLGREPTALDQRTIDTRCR